MSADSHLRRSCSSSSFPILFRFMVSCAKSIFATSTLPSMTPTHQPGVSCLFTSIPLCCPPKFAFRLAHPTLNRHSPPEVVANFKRRVPPRLPKPRKRPDTDQHSTIPPPRSASGLGTVPLTIPSSSLGLTSSPKGGRARGFSAPGPYQPMAQAGTTGQWGNTYNRALPPLTVPSDPPLAHGAMYPSSPALHPVSPADDHGSFNPLHYPSNREVIASAYPYPEQSNWSFSPISSGSSSSHSGSLTSLLNPPSNGSNYPPTRPTINTSYPSSLSSVSMQHSASSLSPDSRPATGYSVSSMSSLPMTTIITPTNTLVLALVIIVRLPQLRLVHLLPSQVTLSRLSVCVANDDTVKQSIRIRRLINNIWTIGHHPRRNLEIGRITDYTVLAV